MPSLRSSIRKRLEAEAEQDSPAEESNPVEQADNPVEAAAAEAVAKKLDEQPSPVVEPKQPRWEDDDAEDFTDEVNQLNLRLADAQAQVAGHKFGSREYVDAIANNLRREDSPRRERGSPPPMAPVSRSTPSWSSGRTTPSKTEVTAEEAAFARSVGVDLEEYRRNKAKMLQMKASGVIQE